MEKYIHKVQYYETDKMGITHHSNYIRWLEEARVDFFEKIGFDYSGLESEGIISPVVKVQCNYKNFTKFEEYIEIEVKVKEFKGVKLIFEYLMKNVGNGVIVAQAQSEHCFINNQGKPIILKKVFPEFDKKLKSLIDGKELNSL